MESVLFFIYIYLFRFWQIGTIKTSKTHLLQIESALQYDFNTLQHRLTANKLLLNKTKSHTISGTCQSIKSNAYTSVTTCPDGTPLIKLNIPKTWAYGLTLNFHLNDILIILLGKLISVLVYFTDPETAFHLLLERSLCYN